MRIIVASILAIAASSTFGQSASVAQSFASPAPRNVQYYDDRERQEERGDVRRAERREEFREERRAERLIVGDRLPPNLLDNRVNDWRRAGLGFPPRGREWIRAGDRFMLVRLRDSRIERIVDR